MRFYKLVSSYDGSFLTVGCTPDDTKGKCLLYHFGEKKWVNKGCFIMDVIMGYDPSEVGMYGIGATLPEEVEDSTQEEVETILGEKLNLEELERILHSPSTDKTSQ